MRTILCTVLALVFSVQEADAQCKLFGRIKERRAARASNGNGAGGCAGQQSAYGAGGCSGAQSYGYSYYQPSTAYQAAPAGMVCVNGVCYPYPGPMPTPPAQPRLPQAPSSLTSTEFEEIAAIRASLNDLNTRIARLEARR